MAGRVVGLAERDIPSCLDCRDSSGQNRGARAEANEGKNGRKLHGCEEKSRMLWR